MARVRNTLLASIGLSGAFLGSALAPMTAASAAEPVRLTLQNHQFSPDRVTVPAGERFQIEVFNRDPTPSEFESHDLRFEKVVTANSRITVYAGPLKPGSYKFFDDYHPDAIGTIVAVEKKG